MIGSQFWKKAARLMRGTQWPRTQAEWHKRRIDMGLDLKQATVIVARELGEDALASQVEAVNDSQWIIDMESLEDKHPGAKKEIYRRAGDAHRRNLKRDNE